VPQLHGNLLLVVGDLEHKSFDEAEIGGDAAAIGEGRRFRVLVHAMPFPGELQDARAESDEDVSLLVAELVEEGLAESGVTVEGSRLGMVGHRVSSCGRQGSAVSARSSVGPGWVGFV